MLGALNQIFNPIFSAFSSISPRGATIFDAIESGNLDQVKKIIEKDPSVLEQKDSYGYTPFFNAILFKNPEIVKVIIEKDPSVLKQTYGNGNTPLSLATLRSCESDYRDKDNRSEVLQIILDHQFQRHIDKASQEVFKEFSSKKMLLKGIYSGEYASFTFEGLEKAFDEIAPESIFKEIYQDLFKKVNKNQPITSTNNEDMYIFESNLENHSSFFIFHVNKKDGKLTSISYCDGYAIDEGRKIKDSATHINGVTTFKLKAPIEYSYEKFAKNFIEKNTEDKSLEVFYKKFKEKKIVIEGAEIDYEKTTHSIPTRAQKRGNCTFKSSFLVARKISEQLNPETMDYGFDLETQEPTGNGHYEYKEFKAQLAENALVSIIAIKKTIPLESDLFNNHLRKEFEDTMEMGRVHVGRKLMHKRKLMSISQGEVYAEEGKEGHEPKESLSPLTNKPSPLSTKMTNISLNN